MTKHIEINPGQEPENQIPLEGQIETAEEQRKDPLEATYNEPRVNQLITPGHANKARVEQVLNTGTINKLSVITLASAIGFFTWLPLGTATYSGVANSLGAYEFQSESDPDSFFGKIVGVGVNAVHTAGSAMFGASIEGLLSFLNPDYYSNQTYSPEVDQLMGAASSMLKNSKAASYISYGGDLMKKEIAKNQTFESRDAMASMGMSSLLGNGDWPAKSSDGAYRNDGQGIKDFAVINDHFAKLENKNDLLLTSEQIKDLAESFANTDLSSRYASFDYKHPASGKSVVAILSGEDIRESGLKDPFTGEMDKSIFIVPGYEGDFLVIGAGLNSKGEVDKFIAGYHDDELYDISYSNFGYLDARPNQPSFGPLTVARYETTLDISSDWYSIKELPIFASQLFSRFGSGDDEIFKKGGELEKFAALSGMQSFKRHISKLIGTSISENVSKSTYPMSTLQAPLKKVFLGLNETGKIEGVAHKESYDMDLSVMIDHQKAAYSNVAVLKPNKDAKTMIIVFPSKGEDGLVNVTAMLLKHENGKYTPFNINPKLFAAEGQKLKADWVEMPGYKTLTKAQTQAEILAWAEQ